MKTSLFRTRTAILACLLLLALALPAQAARGKHAKKHTGKLAGVTQTFTVAAGAKISVAGDKHAALADIKVGDRVKIAYTQANGTLTAIHIKDAVTNPAKHAKKAKSTTKKHHKHHKHASANLHAKGIVQSVDTTNQTLTITEKHRH